MKSGKTPGMDQVPDEVKKLAQGEMPEQGKPVWLCQAGNSPRHLQQIQAKRWKTSKHEAGNKSSFQKIDEQEQPESLFPTCLR